VSIRRQRRCSQSAAIVAVAVAAACSTSGDTLCFVSLPVFSVYMFAQRLTVEGATQGVLRG
jgi:ABC-type maltose transport system permease subunit